jgi:hypothetical protein
MAITRVMNFVACGCVVALCAGTAASAAPKKTGPEQVQKAKELVDTLRAETFATAVKKLEEVAGKATVNGAEYTWSAAANDTCTYLTIAKSKARDAIGSVKAQPLVKKADFVNGGGNYADCLKVAGTK